VQTMRRRAQQAGNLKSTPQEKVAAQGDTIVIQPANPDVVYVPVYDPWVVYGPGLIAYPGWFWYPGLYAVGPGISFGVGFGIGFFGGFGWGWHHWGADWHGHGVVYNHNGYVPHDRPYGDHDHFDHGHFDHNHFDHGPAGGFAGRAPLGGHSSGFNHGGVPGAYSSRGQAGGGFHGGGDSHGGGGFHGGGGGSHGGGHR